MLPPPPRDYRVVFLKCREKLGSDTKSRVKKEK